MRFVSREAKEKVKEKDRHKEMNEKREELTDRGKEKRTKERKDEREEKNHLGKVISFLNYLPQLSLSFLLHQFDRDDEWTERDRDNFNGSSVDPAEPDRGALDLLIIFIKCCH